MIACFKKKEEEIGGKLEKKKESLFRRCLKALLVSKLSINVEEEMTTSQTDRYKRHQKAPDLRCRQ